MPKMKDIIHTNDAAKAVVVDAQTAIKAEKQAKAEAWQHSAAEAERRAQELHRLSEISLGEAVADRVARQRRFWGLAWGSNVEGLVKALKEASYDPKAYVRAYEVVTGTACHGVPGRVYRNAKLVG